jgi:phage tail sheath gpL-like
VRQPFLYQDDSTGTAYLEAVNAGSHANDWLIRVRGIIAGLTVTLTGWSGGGTNPALTNLFTPVANIRYQTVVYPSQYTQSTLVSWIDARKNVSNRIMDGRAFIYQNVALATAKTNSLAANSSEVVILNNVPTSNSMYIGPHIPEAPDVVAAQVAAARALRFETGVSITDIVSTNAPADQFGGIQTASLPYFNTPLVNCGRPYTGSGYDQTSQTDAENHGVSVVGVNDSTTMVVTGVLTTTWQTDVAGTPDTTWKYLEWRDTHGTIREYIVNNLRKRFEQSRLTNGDVIPNRDMANAALIRGYILGLCQDCMDFTLIQAGQASRQFIQDNMTVTIDLATRTATVYLLYKQVSQLENIVGTIQYTFTAQ